MASLLDGKGNLVRSRKQTKGNLFYLDLGDCSCFIAQVEESWLWHRRLCHVNFDNNEDKMVYIAIKDEFDDEGDKMTLISHVKKKWYMDY